MKLCTFVLSLSIYTGCLMDLRTKLRIEKSENCSGELLNFSKIKRLKESHYYVIPQLLDGDAPKEFISRSRSLLNGYPPTTQALSHLP